MTPFMKSLFIILGTLIALSFIVLLSALFGMMFADPQPILPVVINAFALLVILCTVLGVTLRIIPHGKRK